MNQQFPNLLTPFKIGNVELKNRMCVSPMGLFYNEVLGPFGEYTHQAIEYVTHRAKGGFGLMFLGTNFLPDIKVDEQDPTFHFMSHPDKFITAASEMTERADMFGMKMTDKHTFSPSTPIDRAMFETVLYRIAGEPAADAKSPFKDVADNSYCCSTVEWAAENGIVLGYADGNFRPRQAINREQMACKGVISRWCAFGTNTAKHLPDLSTG